MAMAGSSSGTLYVGVAAKRANYMADLVGIWRTDNAWASSPNWALVPSPAVNSDGSYSPRFWYHFSMLVDPDNAGILYLTEYDVWRYSGSSWGKLTGGVHVDNHVMAWVIGAFNDKRLLLGNDGGDSAYGRRFIENLNGSATGFQYLLTLHSPAIAQAYLPGKNLWLKDFMPAEWLRPDVELQSLPPEVPLVAGKITCTTCHSQHAAKSEQAQLNHLRQVK